MRAVVVIVGILAGACSDNAEHEQPDLAVACAVGCATVGPTCMAGHACLGPGTVAAACWKTCRTTDDCAAGLACISVDNNNLGTDLAAYDHLPRFCVPHETSLCPGANPPTIFDGQHCDFTDANTIAYSFMSNFGAAFEYIHCPSGCERSVNPVTHYPACRSAIDDGGMHD
jgi:hypothetical protein